MLQRSGRVVILGGGLTGLSAAYHLRSGYVLLERETRLGGLARTDVKDGFFFDKTGHWLHLRDAYVRRLMERLLPRKLVAVERRARIFSNGVFTRYPFQANLYGLPPEVAAECLLGFVEARMQGSHARPPKTFEEYCLRHFGVGISKHFMIPYNTKLYGVHPREITADWCQRFVPIPKLEEVVKGAVGVPPPEMGYNMSFLYPRRGGIEVVVQAFASRLRGEVRLESKVTGIDLGNRHVLVGEEKIPYDAVVSTIPLPELVGLIRTAPHDVKEAARRLCSTPLRYLDVALRRPAKTDLHWVYVPEAEYPFYRVGSYSNAVRSMAPKGCASLYVELSERRPVPRHRLVTQVTRGLVEMGIIEGPDDILFADIKEIPRAYVIFDRHYDAATRLLREWLEEHDIYPRGRFGFWTYNSMEDCILAGRDVARILGRPASPR